MLKGFKDFIMRGNVIDLAVAVVIGTAFTGIVNALVDKLLNPALGALFNADSLSQAWIVEIPTISGDVAELGFGAIVAAAIQFLLVAVAVYFALVVPINRMKRIGEVKRANGASDEEAPPSELEVLTQIRDLLATAETRNGGGSGSHVA